VTVQTILCYGDSNTYGTVPMEHEFHDERYPADIRWPGVLAAELGAGSRIIEEGLPGRTTVHDDPIEGASRNGGTYLLPCLGSHKPLDAIVLMLGTNDLKNRFSVTPQDIGWSMQALVELIETCRPGHAGGMPKLLLVAPAPIEEISFLGEIFAGGAAKSRKISAKYKAVAAHCGAEFLDAGEVIKVSGVDGIHFDADQHRLLGRAVATRLRPLLANA
jgi:lysophospholipase L1-like esterase